jgi:hypothetical protein
VGDGSGVRLTWGHPVSFPARCPARCRRIRRRLRCRVCCLRRIRRRRRSRPNLLGLARVSIRGTGKTGHLPGRYTVGSGGSGGTLWGAGGGGGSKSVRVATFGHAARFGEHAPGGHKRPLLPVPLNAIMAQLAKALRIDLTTLCSNLVYAVFFLSYIIIIIK